MPFLQRWAALSTKRKERFLAQTREGGGRGQQESRLYEGCKCQWKCIENRTERQRKCAKWTVPRIDKTVFLSNPSNYYRYTWFACKEITEKHANSKVHFRPNARCVEVSEKKRIRRVDLKLIVEKGKKLWSPLVIAELPSKLKHSRKSCKQGSTSRLVLSTELPW